MDEHKHTQADWEQTAAGRVTGEKKVTKPGGTPGQVDIHVEVEPGLAAVIEIKETDWDALTERGVRRQVKRAVEQVWDYIEAELARGVEVSPAVILTRRPATESRLEQIETLFNESGIAVDWQEESIAERRARSEQGPPATPANL